MGVGAAEAVTTGRTLTETTALRDGRSRRVPWNFRRYAVFTVGLTGNRTTPSRSVRDLATSVKALPAVRARSTISRRGMSMRRESSLPRTRLVPSPATGRSVARMDSVVASFRGPVPSPWSGPTTMRATPLRLARVSLSPA